MDGLGRSFADYVSQKLLFLYADTDTVHPIFESALRCVYDVVSGDRLYGWDLSAPCWAIALAPDGRHVAAAQRDGITLILRLPDGPVR